MKRIVIVVMCTGMSVGLALGFGIDAKNTQSVAASVYASPESQTETVNLSYGDFLANDEFSVTKCGVDNFEYKALKAEINFLKDEMKTMRQDSAEYAEAILKLHKAWGKLSVLMGGLNSRIDISADSLMRIAAETDELGFTVDDFCGLINYPAEESLK